MEKIKPFGTNPEPIMFNLVNGRVTFKINNSELVQKRSSSLYSNLISNLYIVCELTAWPRNPNFNFSSECQCKSDGTKCNSNEKLNNVKCRYDCKNRKEHHLCKKGYAQNPATCSCENSKYLANSKYERSFS